MTFLMYSLPRVTITSSEPSKLAPLFSRMTVSGAHEDSLNTPLKPKEYSMLIEPGMAVPVNTNRTINHGTRRQVNPFKTDLYVFTPSPVRYYLSCLANESMAMTRTELRLPFGIEIVNEKQFRTQSIVAGDSLYGPQTFVFQ